MGAPASTARRRTRSRLPSRTLTAQRRSMRSWWSWIVSGSRGTPSGKRAASMRAARAAGAVGAGPRDVERCPGRCPGQPGGLRDGGAEPPGGAPRRSTAPAERSRGRRVARRSRGRLPDARVAGRSGWSGWSGSLWHPCSAAGASNGRRPRAVSIGSTPVNRASSSGPANPRRPAEKAASAEPQTWRPSGVVTTSRPPRRAIPRSRSWARPWSVSQSSTRLSRSVGPPKSQWRMWWACSRSTRASGQPGRAQPPSRRSSARR